MPAKAMKRRAACSWAPGIGPDANALRRLEQYAPMPAQPMGEAWFMGERRLYTELLDRDSSRWPIGVVESAVNSLASGPGCFGPLKEWTDWLHFLMPRLVACIDGRRWEDIYQRLVTAFMAQYLSDREAYPYPGFLDDTLATLGRVPMSALSWDDGKLIADGVIEPVVQTPSGPFLSGGGGLSASLFLHLKYLDEEALPAWIASVGSIEDPVWRTKIVLWIAQSRELLCEPGRQPDILNDESSYDAGWMDCWCLKGSNPSIDVDPTQVVEPFLSDARRQLFRDELQRLLTSAWLDALHADVAGLELLQPEMYLVRLQLEQASRDIRRDYSLVP